MRNNRHKNVRVLQDFQNNQTLMFTKMPVGNLDKATNLDKDTKGVVRVQNMEHVDSDTVVWDKHRGDDLSVHGEAYDNLCGEPHDNEGWIEDHDCEAATWRKDVSDNN
jgi:hypothetical protein